MKLRQGVLVMAALVIVALVMPFACTQNTMEASSSNNDAFLNDSQVTTTTATTRLPDCTCDDQPCNTCILRSSGCPKWAVCPEGSKNWCSHGFWANEFWGGHGRFNTVTNQFCDERFRSLSSRCHVPSSWYSSYSNCGNCGDLPCSCRGTHIDCSHAGLTAIPSGFPATTTGIDLSYNSITTVPPQSFDGLTALQSLDLSHNRIVALADQAVAGLESLKTLNLPHNYITGLAGLPFGDIYSLESLDLAYNNITFASQPGTLSQAFDSLSEYHWSGRANGTDTGILNMTGNPLSCALVTIDFSGEVSGIVKCECRALNTSELAFCPRETDPYRFQCEINDTIVDVPSTSVCDGAANCLPSGIDEAVCHGVFELESTKNGTCLFSSPAMLQACNGAVHYCFEALRVSVISGIATFESAVPCGQQFCPPGFGLVTAREAMIGASEAYTFEFQGTKLDVNVAAFGSLRGLRFACEHVYRVSVGMPAGIESQADTTLVTQPPNTTTTQLETSAPTPSVSPQTPHSSTPDQPTSLPNDGSETVLPMAVQASVVAIVCLVQALILVIVAAFLYQRRRTHILLEQSWLRHESLKIGRAKDHDIQA